MQTIIPAGPGWSVVIPCTDNGAVTDICLDPIIAWLIEHGPKDIVVSYPITAIDGIQRDSIIQRPDGAFEDWGSGYADKDAVIKEFNDRDAAWCKSRQGTKK